MKMDLQSIETQVGWAFQKTNDGWMICQMHIGPRKKTEMLTPAEWQELNGLAAFSFDRANHKFLRSYNPSNFSRVKPQAVKHYYLLSDYGMAWAFSIILQADAVHIQSPLFSIFALHHPDDEAGVTRPDSQLDHLTGKWEEDGLGRLHLTTVRDATGLYDPGQVRYRKTATVFDHQPERKNPIFSYPGFGPHPFFYLGLQDRDIQRLVQVSKTLDIGGSKFNTNGQFKTSLRYSNTSKKRLENACQNHLVNGITVLDLRTGSPLSAWHPDRILEVGIFSSQMNEPACPKTGWQAPSYCDETTFTLEYESVLNATNVGKTRIASGKAVRVHVGHGVLDSKYHPDTCFLAHAVNHQSQCVFDFEW